MLRSWTSTLLWAGLAGALAATTSVTAGGAATEEFVRVRVDSANLRSAPGTQAGPIRLSYENEPLKVLGRRQSWLEVEDFRGERGWIYAPLTDGSASVVVTSRLANVRSGPSQDQAVMFTAERGVHLLVVDEKGQWLRVRHEDGDQGWIHASLVWGAW